MKKPVTIVMYHYVRPIARGRYPGLRGLEPEQFAGQLDYIGEHYNWISFEELLSAIDDNHELPERSALLQFDDGYTDHLVYVFPELQRRGIKGVFFPITSPALDRNVIVVHKVQFILACTRDLDDLILEMERTLVELSAERSLPSLAEYRKRYFVPTRIDSAPVIYLKRMFQVGLPSDLSEQIAGVLFRKYVTVDERGFADELYMSVDQLKILIDGGHHLGCHTDRHPWMGSLTKEQQRTEIASALRLHDQLGMSRRNFTFCYPYGDYNAESLEVLEELQCSAAFTAEVALAKPTKANRFTLPRLDTIDLPFDKFAAPNEWTRITSMAPAS